MSGYLLDTNVISMLSPSRASASSAFLAWLELKDAEDRIFLSVVTIHEIEKGIALLDHRGAVAKAGGLKVWLAGLVATYDDKILGIDATAASIGGQLEAAAITAGHAPGMADAAIAGIAKAHNLIVITDNIKHFLPFGVAVSSPDEVARTAS
ncbi:PIN domain-containing protein [Telmatospirillum sp.]|uniref:PIN domain-containing protein n=1 Tax=Telmatospirillum sp. TaxID=2079197 RepID=UPI002842BE09|nr:PIN domain-containing protein [Telmatospirillum sp.]MDR3438104.1 PIN domain-containing protein [Telmatospirillum sp.]